MAKGSPEKNSDDNQKSSITIPRIHKFHIKNFRSIGTEGLSVDIHNLLSLAGIENPGNDSLYVAYCVIMQNSYQQSPLTLEDFFGQKIDPENLPHIEIQFLNEDSTIRKDRWIWMKPGEYPVHVRLNQNENHWENVEVSQPEKFKKFYSDIIFLPLTALMDRALSIKWYADGNPFANEQIVKNLNQIQDEMNK